jgi:hypothetical protein
VKNNFQNKEFNGTQHQMELDVTSQPKWYLRRIVLLRSFSVFIFSIIFLFLFSIYIEPSSEKIFSKKIRTTGIFNCCEKNGRYTNSYLNNNPINCGDVNYYFGGHSDCSRFRQYDQSVVTIVEVEIPNAFSKELQKIVVEFNSFEKNKTLIDEHLFKSQWRKNSFISSIFLSYILLIIFHIFQIYYINPSRKKSQGKLS